MRGVHLFALEVAQAWRNRGVGSEVVRWVVDEARRRGQRRVYLEVRLDNPARRLYHRLGFRRVGEPFINAWWRFQDDGSQERVEEESVRMVRRV
jgi:ribosomal protein S18 acetylase RimI-like enzyme